MDLLPYKRSPDRLDDPTTERGANGLADPDGLRFEALEPPANGRLAQRSEHSAYTRGVGGSNPSLPTSFTSETSESDHDWQDECQARAESATPANTVRIFVGAGMSFEVPRSAYDEALTMATLQRKVWYVGLTETGVEVGPSREDLFDKGCKSIAWVTPLNSALVSR